ncbi:MAG TPA: ATP-binding protein, partial [Phototrophicaceae bacterium]|nr:ATP-binding protein [Phototrophicaceae bacterium]
MSKRNPRFFTQRLRITLPVFLLIVIPAAVVSYLLVIGTDADVSPATKQAFAGGAALVSVMITGGIYLLTRAATRRLDRVTNTVQSLRAGHSTARTGMRPIDEVGKVGSAIDQYADAVQERHDKLRVMLRRKRREVTHLLSVLESMPDGVIVQDLDGRVILMNEVARKLLGSARVFRSSGLHELTALVTDKLGPMLSPGLYALGDPQRVELDGKMLSAQAAAIMTMTDARLGTVILLRDITDIVKRERTRDIMLNRMTRDVQQPLVQLARNTLQAGGMVNVNDFARELTRHAFSLQKMIVQMQDISDVDEVTIQRTQQPIQLETLVWAVSNEWRQIAQANRLRLQVMIEQKGLFVLGDERRLRWAIGNLIDNSIKYTQANGTLTVEIQGEENHQAKLRVRDNGVGILPDEMSNLFTRFWRGTPTTS